MLRQALFLLFCLPTCGLYSQWFSAQPPGKGGFAVQLSAAYMPGSNTELSGIEASTTAWKSTLLHTHLQAQLRVKERWIVAVKLPLFNQAKVENPVGTHTLTGFSHAELGLRYLMLKPGLIDQQQYLMVGVQIVSAVRAPKPNAAGLALGYSAWAIETSILGGLSPETVKMQFEGGLAFGNRLGGQSDYLRAFGKFSLPFKSIIPALTLQYQGSLRNGTFVTPPEQNLSNLYSDLNRNFLVGLDVRYQVSRFWGVTAFSGFPLSGQEQHRAATLGTSVWFQWN